MSRTEEIACGVLKCASCYKVLKDPVPEDDNGSNFTCSQCREETARKLISGTKIKLCDFPADHGAKDVTAKWSCFDCGKNMCSSCHDKHTKGHKVSLLAYPAALENIIWGGERSDVSSQEAEQTDSANQDNITCPICNGARCSHVEKLQSLIAGLQNCNSHCKQQGHVDANNQPLELKFFCKSCWTPVCRDCGIGKHKTAAHDTDDMSDCGKSFVVKSLEVLRMKLQMLIRTSQRDANEAVVSEKRLQSHVTDTDLELNSRKEKVIEQTIHAFNDAISNAATEGRSILTDYRENLNNIRKFQSFLTKTEDALHKIATDLKQAEEIEQYIGAFYLQECANKLIEDFDEGYRKFPKLKERRLILPEMDAITTPPPCLAQVKTEVKQLQLAFSFELRGDYSRTTSIVLTDVDKCLLTFKQPRYTTKYDGIVLCHYKGNDCAVFKEYEVEKGTYYLSRLSSGEIIASFSCDNNCPKSCTNKILYFNGNLPTKDTEEFKFDVVTYFQFPPYGIATTKDNTIILCVCADDPLPDEKMHYENKNLCHVISMSLRGKILKSSLQQPDANLMRADYMAVSDSGEICISDIVNNSIVILNEDLTIKERMNYQLPTSMENVERFQPHGLCYDAFGRIIVADPDNNSVVRLVRDRQSHKYILEPLLNESAGSGFMCPKLVALSKGDLYLWVVCVGKVFVFDYRTFMMSDAM